MQDQLRTRATGAGMRRIAALAMAAIGAVLLAGCLDVEQEIAFNTDGTIGAVVRLSIDREVEEVYAAAEALAKFSGDPMIAAIGTGGLCSPSALKLAPPAAEHEVEIRRSVSGNRSICELRKASLPARPERLDPMGLGLITMTPKGPREVHLAVDLGKLPDLTPMLLMWLLGEMQRRPDLRATRADLHDVTAKLKRAGTALTTMAMRDRHIQITISAPRLIASAGAVSSDAHSARFRITFAELAELVLNSEARAGKRYSVTVAY